MPYPPEDASQRRLLAQLDSSGQVLICNAGARSLLCPCHALGGRGIDDPRRSPQGLLAPSLLTMTR
jgi:hypothetical protein